jgi:hypothetical protein
MDLSQSYDISQYIYKSMLLFNRRLIATRLAVLCLLADKPDYSLTAKNFITRILRFTVQLT